MLEKRWNIEHWFIHFARSCEELETPLPYPITWSKRPLLPAVAESREENKVPSAGWPATVVELPSGGCMCRTRINIAQHAARIEGKTSTARRVFRYSGRTTGGVLGSRRVSAGQRFTRCRRKPTKESATSTTMITRAEYAIQRTVTREDGRIRVTIQRRFKTSRYDGSRGTTNDSRWPRSW